MTKLQSITIKEDSATVKWEANNGSQWSVTSSELLGSRFADSIKALSEVAGKVLDLPADVVERMAVRSIVIKDDEKKGQLFTLSGLTGVESESGTVKPGRFKTPPKQEVGLIHREAFTELERAAMEWAKARG